MLDIRKASAGSGKTYQLTYEYIRLVLGYVDDTGTPRLYSPKSKENHKKILAITFTNKATEEMKQRIIKQLYLLSIGSDKTDYWEQLCKYYRTRREQIQESSKKALVELLNNFSDFNVSTIDSFFQIILRTFAREVEIGAEYGVEVSDMDINTMGAMNLISSLEQTDNKALNAWLGRFIKSKIVENKNWNVFQSGNNGFGNDTLSLFNIAKQLSSEKLKRNKKELLKYWNDPQNLEDFAKALNGAIKRCNDAQTQAAKDIVGLLKSENVDYEQDFKGAVKNKLNKLLEPDNKDFSCTSSFLTNHDDEAKFIKKGKSVTNIETLINLLRNICDAYRKGNTFTLMQNSVYQFGLLGSISQNVEAYRDENDVILLSDTNDLLQEIVGKSSTPFVYERIGMRINNFLIDEFQDTSRMQYDNLSPLLEESLSNDNFDLVIGDEKQSIYRFRNADPSLLQTEISKDFGFSVKNSTPAISTNYRSDRNVILFNNSVFHVLTQGEQGGLLKDNMAKLTYSNVLQKVRPNAPEGYVNVEFFKTEKDVKKWTEKAVENTIVRIKEILNRGYRQSDIAIIVSRHTEGASIIDAILKDKPNEGEQSLKVISDESLYLNKCATINLVINVLEYLDGTLSSKENEEDNVKNVDIIQLLKNYHSFVSQGECASNAIEKALAIAEDSKIDVFDTDYFKKNPASIYNIVDYILKNLVSKESVERDNPFIAAFQDLVLSYTTRNNPSIHSFLTWWKLNDNRSINSPSNIDAINVITIHKSKGLEYPCVIIPFGGWDLAKSDSLLWVKPKLTEELGDHVHCPPIYPIQSGSLALQSYFSEDVEIAATESLVDNLNKTYVAFTRAVHELHIFCEETEKKTGTSLSDILWNALHSCANVESKDLQISLDMGLDEKCFTVGEPVANTKQVAKVDTEPMPAYSLDKYETENNEPRFAFKLPEVEGDPRHTGTVYHNLMSNIYYSDEIDIRVEQAVKKKWIKSSQVEVTKETIRKYIAQDGVGAWFDKRNKVINERWLVNKRRENYRADRIVITPEGETIVIDYKFGAEKLDKKYSKQVKNYMSILEDCGFNNVKGKIWYPELCEIVDVK